MQQAPASTAGEKQALPGIDLLRGTAVALVLLFHLHQKSGVPIADLLLTPFHTYGWTGVDLFFVISGFCIHWGYGRAGQPFNATSYIWRRFRRIYPPYFLALVLAILGLALGLYLRGEGSPNTTLSTKQVVTHLLLVHNFWPETLGGISVVFWTIAVEFQFYLVYIAFRPLMRGRSWLAAIAISLAAHIVASKLVIQGWPELWSVFRYWLAWVMGAGVAAIYRSHRSHRSWWVVVGAGAAVLATMAAAGSDLDGSFRPIWSLGYALLMLGVLWGPQGYLAWRPFALLSRLGLISYSVYLVHLLIITRADAYIYDRLEPGFGLLLAMILTLPLALGASALFYRFCERPFLNTRRTLPSTSSSPPVIQPLPLQERPYAND